MFGLLTRVAIVASIPAIGLTKRANAGVYQQVISTYPDELILILCGILMVIGCASSIVTPDPEGVTPTSPVAKFIYSVFGSILALIYLVFYEKELALAHAAWVGGVSFVSPAIVPSLKMLTFELLPTLMGVVKNKIERLFSSGANK